MEIRSLTEKVSWKPKAGLVLGTLVCLFNLLFLSMFSLFFSVSQVNIEFAQKLFDFWYDNFLYMILLLLVGFVATLVSLFINFRGRKFILKTDKENKPSITLYSWGIALSIISCLVSLCLLAFVAFVSLLSMLCALTVCEH